MKKIFILFSAALLSATVWAQSPEKMSYQAVIRDASDNLITNQAVSMQVSILQGDVFGASIYVETQSANTNENGLLSVEIGSEDAIVVKGDFSSIDWATGPFYLKTETDPAGGTNYTITGTSQLLSVPYALHAKTAESLTGGLTETDPTFTASEAANITSGDITNLGNLSGVNTGDQDGSETKVTAGSNVTVTGSGTTASPYVVNTNSLAIGDSYQGGIIFWLDESGQHGLIAAAVDQSAGIIWNNGILKSTGTLSDGLYAGKMNTVMIKAIQNADNPYGNYAAKICADYSVTVDGVSYGDWYLPSKYELNLLYQQSTVVGGFANSHYWSSTEESGNMEMDAWAQDFTNGVENYYSKATIIGVRAVRSF